MYSILKTDMLGIGILTIYKETESSQLDWTCRMKLIAKCLMLQNWKLKIKLDEKLLELTAGGGG